MANFTDVDYYLGNPNLPKSTSEFEWTPKMLSELKKCKKNILYFAENFFYIVNLDEGRQKIKLRPYQKRVLRSLRDNRFVCLLASRQIGKCQVGSTKINIRNKRTGIIEEITSEQLFNRAKDLASR
jgi:hypothetical protein